MADSLIDIKKILDTYSNDIEEGIELVTKDISKEAMTDLQNTKSTYQVRTGKYNKGWKVNTKKGRGYINCTVYNATDWQLTHLLEKGHITRNGTTRTRAFPHIAPVEEKYVDKYVQEVERVIQNGG